MWHCRKEYYPYLQRMPENALSNFPLNIQSLSNVFQKKLLRHILAYPEKLLVA